MLSSTLQCDSYLANSIVQHLETKGLLQATRDEGVFLVERSAKSEAFVASQLGKSEFTYYQDADATTELRHKSNNQDGDAPPRRRLAQFNRPSGRGLETAFNSLSCAASLSQVNCLNTIGTVLTSLVHMPYQTSSVGSISGVKCSEIAEPIVQRKRRRRGGN
jgi:hypothetical protein